VAKFTLAPDFAYGDVGSPPKIPEKATLVFEIELIDWESKDDLFADGGVIKTLVKESKAYKEPKAGDEVLCSMKVTNKDGSLIEDKGTFEYVLGSSALGPLERAVDKALTGMKKGEAVTLTCTKDYAFGEEKPDGAIVELCLEELYETKDCSLSKDKSLMKKQVKEGEGFDNPKDCTKVTLKVEVATDGSAALPGFVPATLEFAAGNGEVCDAIECAVRTASLMALVGALAVGLRFSLRLIFSLRSSGPLLRRRAAATTTATAAATAATTTAAAATTAAATTAMDSSLSAPTPTTATAATTTTTAPTTPTPPTTTPPPPTTPPTTTPTTTTITATERQLQLHGRIRELCSSTAPGLAQLQPRGDPEEPGCGALAAKTLVVRCLGPEGAATAALCVLPVSRRICFEKLRAALEAVGLRPVGLAAPDEAEELVGCVMGLVPPVCIEPQLRTLLDASLFAAGSPQMLVAGAAHPDLQLLVASRFLLGGAQAAVADVSGDLCSPETEAEEPSQGVLFPLRAADGVALHFVAVVASVRRVSKVLMFADLLPPGSSKDSRRRDLWLSPDGSGRPTRLQLIAGRSLSERLGRDGAAAVIKRLRPQQLIYVTGRLKLEEPGEQSGSVEPSPPEEVRRKREAQLENDIVDVVAEELRVLEEVHRPVVKVQPSAQQRPEGGAQAPEEFLPMSIVASAVHLVSDETGLGRFEGALLSRIKGWGVLRERLAASADFPELIEFERPEACTPLVQVVGIDAEWRPTTRSLALLQVAFRRSVFLLDIVALSSQPLARAKAAKLLRQLLEAPELFKVGFGLDQDFERLAEFLPEAIPGAGLRSVLDLRDLAAVALPERKVPGGLSGLCKSVLGLGLDKTEQTSDWELRPLRPEQLSYAAQDAHVCVRLFDSLCYNHATMATVPFRSPNQPFRSPNQEAHPRRLRTPRVLASREGGGGRFALAPLLASDSRGYGSLEQLLSPGWSQLSELELGLNTTNNTSNNNNNSSNNNSNNNMDPTSWLPQAGAEEPEQSQSSSPARANSKGRSLAKQPSTTASFGSAAGRSPQKQGSMVLASRGSQVLESKDSQVSLRQDSKGSSQVLQSRKSLKELMVKAASSAALEDTAAPLDAAERSLKKASTIHTNWTSALMSSKDKEFENVIRENEDDEMEGTAEEEVVDGGRNTERDAKPDDSPDPILPGTFHARPETVPMTRPRPTFAAKLRRLEKELLHQDNKQQRGLHGAFQFVPLQEFPEDPSSKAKDSKEGVDPNSSKKGKDKATWGAYEAERDVAQLTWDDPELLASRLQYDAWRARVVECARTLQVQVNNFQAEVQS
ncbi:unnamed protein product, partial [Polarella glacialis]